MRDNSEIYEFILLTWYQSESRISNQSEFQIFSFESYCWIFSFTFHGYLLETKNFIYQPTKTLVSTKNTQTTILQLQLRREHPETQNTPAPLQLWRRTPITQWCWQGIIDWWGDTRETKGTRVKKMKIKKKWVLYLIINQDIILVLGWYVHIVVR